MSVYRGPNSHADFLSAARSIAGKISRIDGVVGILATGGIGRGYCDFYSDLDLVVYVRERSMRRVASLIAVGGLRYREIDLDTPVESYERALRQKSPSRYWSQVMRWDRANAIIVFDTTGRLRDLLRQKLVFPDREQRHLLRQHARAVEEHLIYNFELWRQRGHVSNLAHALLEATEHLILWTYARNRVFQPDTSKWLFYYLENGLVPESKYLRVLRRPYVASIGTVAEANSIREPLLRLCHRLGVAIEFPSVAAVREQCKARWRTIPEATRHYLSW